MSKQCGNEVYEDCAQYDWLPRPGPHRVRWRWTCRVASGGCGEESLVNSSRLLAEFSSACWRTEILILLLAVSWGQHSFPRARASRLLASLGHTGRSVVLGHTLNAQALVKTDEQENGFKETYNFVLGQIHSHPGPRVAH